MNKFEKLQSEIITGTQFIKSYPMLNLINITPSEKSFIELVLSYQNNGQEFYMEFAEIANILSIAKQSVSNLVKSLKSLEYINAKNSSRYKDKFIGSTTFITVNEDNILLAIEEAISNTKNIEVEITKQPKKKASKNTSTKTEEIVSEIKEVALQSMFGAQRSIIDEIQEREEEETYSMFELMKDIISEDETDEVFDFHFMLGNKLNKSTFTKNEIGIGISIAKSDNSISNEVLNKITETIKTV
jgi:hypothetical protein